MSCKEKINVDCEESSDEDLNHTYAYNLDIDYDEDLAITLPVDVAEAQPHSSGWRKSNIHCCWGVCNADTRYLDRLPLKTVYIPFPKLGKLRDGMTEWERNREAERTEKAKRWVHACGQKDFTIDKIKHTHLHLLITLHWGKGPNR